MPISYMETRTSILVYVIISLKQLFKYYAFKNTIKIFWFTRWQN